MPVIGRRGRQLQVRDGDRNGRIFHRTDPGAVVILPEFPKGSRETPQDAIEACRPRLRDKTRHEREAARLGEFGRRTGGPAGFLGLSPEEAACVEVNARLAEGLRRGRLERELTQTARAERIGSIQSRVARMERADATVTLNLLNRALLALGATGRQPAQLIQAK